MRLSLDEGRRRNVFTFGVSVTMLPMRSCPRQFAVRGDDVAAETETAAGPPGGRVDAAGVAGDGGAAGGAGGELGVGAAEGGGAFPAGGATGEDGPGAPASGGGAPESGSIRPKRAAARRILKKYMATIASANAMSSTIVKR
jgi:hypothetical protein